MGFLISIAAKLVGEKAAPFLAYGFIALLLVGALKWMRADAYNDGQRDTDAAWVAAGKKLQEDAMAAAGEASGEALEREQVFVEKQKAERERINAAIQEDRSTFDVLFGVGGVRNDAD